MISYSMKLLPATADTTRQKAQSPNATWVVIVNWPQSKRWSFDPAFDAKVIYDPATSSWRCGGMPADHSAANG